jgi:ABC-2 type transport system ATP-binding protein
VSVISLTNVSKAYQGRPLYTDVTLTIEQGKTHALVGPNGSGKSVMFRLLCGFLRPDSGTVEINRRYLNDRRTFPDNFGIIIDRPGALAHLSGMDNLRALAKIRKRIGDDDIAATMRSFGLDPEARQRVRNYSLGMKQKLALCQAFMESPEVLILDEPFNALDAQSADALATRLQAAAEEGTTIVFTSHEREYVDRLANRVLTIDDARITTAV